MVREWGTRCRFIWTAYLVLAGSARAHNTQCSWNPISLLQPQACNAPVDDTVDAGDHLPWTHRPFCLVPESLGGQAKFCVYTSSSFNDNTGISIIATPQSAASIVEAIQNPAGAWEARKYLVSRTPAENHQPAGLSYEVRPIPGKDMGVVATRQIKQFEVFMVGFPTIIADDDFFPPGNGPVEGPRMFQVAADQLSDQQRLLSLAQSGVSASNVIDDLIRTNSFGVRINERGHMGLYPEIARMNHGCNPSATARFSPRTLSFEAIATRDISVGEEITISYIPLGMATNDRADALQRWGFNCTCSLCTAPAAEREASDRRRVRLTDIPFIMSEENTKDAEFLSLSREFISIIKREGLTREFGEYYHGLSALYYNRKDFDNAMRYAKRALRYAEAFDDPEGSFCQGLRENVDALKTWR